MKRLVVMRHGKAQADGGPDGDRARALTDRGRRDASAVAARIRALGWAPDLVLCSDALRARETWARAAEELPEPREVHVDRRLYLAGPDAVETVLHDLGDLGAGTLMLVGHNPGSEQLVALLCGAIVDLPTAAAALLEREGTEPWWRTVRADAWALRGVLRS